jgi:hypothetical protein
MWKVRNTSSVWGVEGGSGVLKAGEPNFISIYLLYLLYTKSKIRVFFEAPG